MPAVMALPAPMLAASGRPPGALEDWQIEPKLDGYRVIVGVTATELVVRTRGGRDITSQVPELARLCHIGAELVLDGELIAGPADPRTSTVWPARSHHGLG
jgi:ATP-dependent DNA ligase